MDVEDGIPGDGVGNTDVEAEFEGFGYHATERAALDVDVGDAFGAFGAGDFTDAIHHRGH